MSWRQIMFAVDSASALRPSILAKVARVARSMDAEVEFFDCIYDPDISRRGRFGSRGVEQDIREFVEHRHRQLDAKAQPLRERQIKLRTTVRWDNPAYEGLGAALQVYHACVPWPSVVAHSAELQQVTESLREEIHARHCEMSEAAVRALANRYGVSKEQVHVEEGDASESLPRYASRVAAEMVAMGAVSRSGLKRAFIGHTAERVLEALDCDVLIAKSPDFVSPIRRQSVHRLPKGATPRAKYIF